MSIQKKNFSDLVTFTRASGGTSFRPVGRGANLVTNGAMVDANANGLADGFVKADPAQGAYTIVTGNGFTGSAQRVVNSATNTYQGLVWEGLSTIGAAAIGKLYEVTFEYRASTGIVNLHNEFPISLPANTGNAVRVSVIWNPTIAFDLTTLRFLAWAGGSYSNNWMEVGSLSVQEITLDRPGDPIQLFTAPANFPRIDYDPVTAACKGLLIEEQRTNLITYSQQFDNVIWNKSQLSVSANAGIAPDGSQTADLLAASATSIQHYVNGGGASIAANTAGTLSVYAKASGFNTVALSAYGSNLFMAEYNLATGVVTSQVGGTATIQSVGSGWYRCSLTCTTTAFAFAPYIFPGGYTAFVGNNTDGVLVWGAQLEVGAFATSYIPTTGAAATRAADIPQVNTLSPWYNPAEGTLFAEIGSSNGDGPRALTLYGASHTEQVAIGKDVTRVRSGGVDIGEFFSGQVLGSKMAVAWASGSQAAARNGVLQSSSNAGLPPGMQTLFIGQTLAAAAVLNGHIRRIQYIPKRLSDAKLQAMTQPQPFGPNLFTNGDFSNGTAEWSEHNGAQLSVSSGVLTVTNGASGRGGATRQVATVVGRYYELSGLLIAGTNVQGWLIAGTAAGGAQLLGLVNLVGQQSGFFMATSTTTYITLMPAFSTAGLTFSFDNVSLREAAL